MIRDNMKIPRRVILSLIKTILILVAVVGLMELFAPTGWAAADDRKPNIIFILTDDHRWDAMSKLGHPVVETPRLDRLSDEGVHFTNAFVTTSLCSPSRASFLTGTHARTHGVKNNLTPWSDQNVTFLELLKKAGYTTAFIGKWHMPGSLPKLRGLDQFITFTVQAGQGRYFDCPLVVDGRFTPSRKPYITEELTDYALAFITQNKNRAFCLYLSHKAVHHQFLPPPEIRGRYRGKDLHLPPESDAWISFNLDHIYCGLLGPLAWNYRKYLETLHATDREIGRVLDRVDELGLRDNTIVVYVGDNGFFWGEHRLMDKRWAYEESIRVPLIVRAPGLIRDPGRMAPQMALNIDLAPTLLDMAGVAVPAHMEGVSLVPILRDSRQPGRRAWLYEYFKDFPYRIPNIMAVRTQHYKYIEYGNRRPPELFDLARDPREMSNLMGTTRGRDLLPGLQAMLEKLKKGQRP